MRFRGEKPDMRSKGPSLRSRARKAKDDSILKLADQRGSEAILWRRVIPDRTAGSRRSGGSVADSLLFSRS